MFLSMLVAWLIPNVPQSLKEQVKREKAALMELLLAQEPPPFHPTASIKAAIRSPTQQSHPERSSSFRPKLPEQRGVARLSLPTKESMRRGKVVPDPATPPALPT
uniref:Uncharacterized protein n=1 Tax=Denticeps clupeoides TaxID=299321 RepID=A0AAY4BNK3_9TELE